MRTNGSYELLAATADDIRQNLVRRYESSRETVRMRYGSVPSIDVFREWLSSVHETIVLNRCSGTQRALLLLLDQHEKDLFPSQ